MNISTIGRTAVAAAIAILLFAFDSLRAQEPSAAAIAAAKELINERSGNMFDPLVPGVIERVKNVFLPTNPNLGRELNEVAAQLRKDYDPKRTEVLDEVARVYARHFSERELADIVAFYRTPLGRKILSAEPVAIEQSMKRAQSWTDDFSEQVMRRFREEMRKKGHDL